MKTHDTSMKTYEASIKTHGASIKAKAEKKRHQRQAEVFKALGHSGRMAIVHALGGGAVCACKLAAVAGLAASTTSRHLTVLKHAGVIADERRGSQVFYRLSCPCVLTFADCVDRVDAGEKIKTLRVACCA